MKLSLEQKLKIADLLAAACTRLYPGSQLQSTAEELVLAIADTLAEQRVVEFASTVLRASDCATHLRNTLDQYAALGLEQLRPEQEPTQEQLEHARAVIDCGVYGHLNLGTCARCGVFSDVPTEGIVDAYLYEVES